MLFGFEAIRDLPYTLFSIKKALVILSKNEYTIIKMYFISLCTPFHQYIISKMLSGSIF